MKLEDQVCSLELSKRLKILGVRQESFAYWYKPHSCWQLRIDRSDLGTDWENNKIVSAFTVAELGEMLPVETEIAKALIYSPEKWCCSKDERGEWAETMADAMALMLIYLIGNKLLDFNWAITSYPAPGKE